MERQAITVEKAKEGLLQALKGWKRQTEVIDVRQARGRILATDVLAATDVPPFNKSPYDGYALLYSPSQRTYEVVGTVGAGQVWHKPLQAGQALRILTGAAVPAVCDTVVMQEACQRQDNTIRVVGTFTKGMNIIRQGEECEKGTVILRQGIQINAGAMAALVGMGCQQVEVYKSLQVLVVTTGREIVDIDDSLREGTIYNSNKYMLLSALRQLENVNLVWHHFTDAPEAYAEELLRLQQDSQQVDVVISTGGVSVGDYDVIPVWYEACGAETLYRRLLMRPGAASYGGVRKSKGRQTLFLGLSGNPTAAYNGLQLIALPLLRYMQGLTRYDWSIVDMPIQRAIHKKNPFDRYVQGRVVAGGDGTLSFMPNELFSAASLLSSIETNGLAKLEKGRDAYIEGDRVSVLILSDALLR